MCQKVSNFVDAMRQEADNGTQSGLTEPDGGPSTSELAWGIPPGHADAKRRMQQAVIEAEKFRAVISAPSGMADNFNNVHGNEQLGHELSNLNLASQPQPSQDIPGVSANILVVEALQVCQNAVAPTALSDDDFFHLTCHIDSALWSKIERGEYVNLEKLLPKFKGKYSEETRLEWVHRDGGNIFGSGKC